MWAASVSTSLID
jgi:hypothetical protein